MLSNPLKLTFSRLENYLNIVTLSIFLITIFFFLDFRLSSVNKLIFRTCQLLSSSHLGFCQKVLSQHFRFFFPEFQFYTSWQLYLAIQFFWLTPHVPPQTNIVTLNNSRRLTCQNQNETKFIPLNHPLVEASLKFLFCKIVKQYYHFFCLSRPQIISLQFSVEEIRKSYLDQSLMSMEECCTCIILCFT